MRERVVRCVHAWRGLKAFGVVSLALVFAASACGSSDEEKVRAAALGEGCLINTDCEGQLVCAFRRCHVQCSADRDCNAGERCVVSDKPFNVCQLPDEVRCAYNSECPGAQLCGVDGECRDQCTTERDCVAGQICASRTCAQPSELVDGGLPIVADAGPGGVACSFSSECPEPERCVEGRCRLECRADRDCEIGRSCRGSRCVPGGASDGGAACLYDSDCAASERCLGGACLPQCRTNVDCASGERCAAGGGASSRRRRARRRATASVAH